MHPPKLRRLAVPLTRAAGENRARLPEPLGWATAPRSSKHDVRRFSTTETTSNSGDTLRKAKTKVESWVKVPSISAVAGAVALVPVVGGAWLVTEYVIRQRLCEHHLQQVETTAALDNKRRPRSSNGGKKKSPDSPLWPGSSADARALRESLALPARGVTVLCVDPPASYTGDAFVVSALMGRGATVHVRAGKGDGSLAACLARGLGVHFITTKLQVSAILPGANEGGRRGEGVDGSSAVELSDIGAVLQTATAALEEIRSQADDPRNHLPPVIAIDGLLDRIRPGEVVSESVEAVLRWCWTVTGGRRLAHVVLVAPQSMAVDGSLVRLKGFLNDGRLAPGMLRIVGLNSPDSDSTERRLRGGFHDARRPKSGGSGCGAAQGVAEPDEAAEVDRAVALCMELLHGDGCGVAEEANLMMRRVRATQSQRVTPGLRETVAQTMEDIALEGWRRTAAAVAVAAAAESDDAELVPSSQPSSPGPRLLPGGEPPKSSPAEEKRAKGLATNSNRPTNRYAAASGKGEWVPSGDGAEERRGTSSSSVRSDEITPGYLTGDYASLEAVQNLMKLKKQEQDARRASADGAEALHADGHNGPALRGRTPLQRLARLFGKLSDGDKLTVGEAVTTLNGDARALGTLLDLGVLRLSPRTVSGSDAGAAQIDAVQGLMRRLSTLPYEGLGASAFHDVLAEAGESLQVGAATPVIAGIFAVLRGCEGIEKQAIERAINVLRGGKARRASMTSAEQEDWVARRESYTAGLVRRAILQPGVQDGVNVPAARNMSKTLQTAMAALGCMATREEIQQKISVADCEDDGASVATLIPDLVRAFFHRVPDAGRGESESGGFLKEDDRGSESTSAEIEATDDANVIVDQNLDGGDGWDLAATAAATEADEDKVASNRHAGDEDSKHDDGDDSKAEGGMTLPRPFESVIDDKNSTPKNDSLINGNNAEVKGPADACEEVTHEENIESGKAGGPTADVNADGITDAGQDTSRCGRENFAASDEIQGPDVDDAEVKSREAPGVGDVTKDAPGVYAALSDGAPQDSSSATASDATAAAASLSMSATAAAAAAESIEMSRVQEDERDGAPPESEDGRPPPTEEDDTDPPSDDGTDVSTGGDEGAASSAADEASPSRSQSRDSTGDTKDAGARTRKKNPAPLLPNRSASKSTWSWILPAWLGGGKHS